MFLQPQKVSTKKNYIQRSQSIKITRMHIDQLNREIQKSVMEKEIEHEKGLKVAVHCRMR